MRWVSTSTGSRRSRSCERGPPNVVRLLRTAPRQPQRPRTLTIQLRDDARATRHRLPGTQEHTERPSRCRAGPEIVTRTYCAEVLSHAAALPAPSSPGSSSGAAAGRPAPQVKVLLIAQKVDGFYLERLTDNGERVGDTLHETLDDAMYQAYSEYDALSDWRLCPDDADPLQYIRGQSRTDAPRPSQPGAVANLGDP